MSTLNVSEEAAAEMLGIRVAEVKRMRKEMGEDGIVMDGRSFRITPAGLKKMTAAVRGKIPADVPADPVLVDLLVDSTCPNPRIILCTVAGDEKKTRVRCRVRDARNFTRHMEIPGCRMVQETLYAYEGRLPRIKGRWL